LQVDRIAGFSAPEVSQPLVDAQIGAGTDPDAVVHGELNIGIEPAHDGHAEIAGTPQCFDEVGLRENQGPFGSEEVEVK